MVQHETGNGLFAYPRGRPGRDRQIGEKIPCPVDVDQKLQDKKMMDPHCFVLAFHVMTIPR